MFKYYLRKLKVLIIITSIIKNYKSKFLTDFGIYKSKAGATHSALTMDQSIKYIFDVFNDYIFYAGIKEDDLKEKEILEIGPGDNLGVALLFLAKGAKKLTCMDRFYSVRDIGHQIQIYKSIRSQLNDIEKKRFDECIISYDKLEFDKTKLSYIYGKGIEEAYFEEAYFDLIVSRAALEHIYNINKAFSVMKKALKPGGYLIHKVDLRDHGIFSSSGGHPLTFLTINSKIWRMMSEYCGRPNRKRIDCYRLIADPNDFDSRIYITHIVGLQNELIPHRIHIEYPIDYREDTLKLIKEIRPRISPEFRHLSDEDLSIAGIFLVAQKHK